MEDNRSLARRIKPQRVAALERHQGVVQAVNADGTANITIDGSTQVKNNVSALTSVLLRANDTVELMMDQDDVFIIGKLGPNDLELVSNSIDAPAPLTDWPFGHSFMGVTSSALTWPLQYGVVETFRSGAFSTDYNRQIFSGMSGDPTMWFRRWVIGTASWTDWFLIAEDTGWIAMNPINGWEAYGGIWPANLWSPRYRRKNNVVYFEGLVRDLGGATSNIFFVLPVGYRPTDNTMRAAQTQGGGQLRYDIEPNGNCTAYGTQADASATTGWVNIGRSLIID